MHPHRAIAVLLWAFALLALVLTGCEHRHAPPAVDGVVPLSSTALARPDGIVTLDGPWQLYWGQLLTPSQLNTSSPPTPTGLVRLPAQLTGMKLRGLTIPPTGYATLHLTVKGLPDSRRFALHLANVTTSYRLWANGEPVASMGKVGTSLRTSMPQEGAQVVTVAPKAGHLDLVLQVANFRATDIGVKRPILFGTEEQVRRLDDWLQSGDIALFGALMLLGLYHLGIFVLRRRAKVALYIALISLLWGARILVDGMTGGVWGPLVGLIPWNVGVTADMVLLYWAVATIVLLIAYVHPVRGATWVARLALATAGVFSLITIAFFTPQIELMGVWEMLSACFLVYSLSVSIWHLLKHRELLVMFSTLSVIALSLTGVHDMILDTWHIDSVFLMPVGVLGFVLLQSISVAVGLDRVLASVQTLSRKLERTNIELKHKDALKDELLAVTSHELQTPLHAMIGLASALTRGSEGPIPPPLHRNLSLIEASGRRLSRLVRNTLDSVRLKHDDLHLHLAPVRLDAIAGTAISLLAPVVEGKPVSLQMDMPANLPPVQADEDRLYQVIFNLLGNAIKFTDHGTVRIEAHVVEQQVNVSVVDTGRGISASQQQAIFDANYRVDTSVPGFGLGLSVSKQLLDLHGSELTVASEPGHGTRFSFSLPAVQPSDVPAREDKPARALSVPEAPGQPSLDFQDRDDGDDMGMDGARSSAPERDNQSDPQPPVHVLVVDDDVPNLRVIDNHLKLRGWRVSLETSGTDALRQLESGLNPDVILLDLMMPGMNGLQVCEEIRKDWSMLELPVLLLTAAHNENYVVQGLAVGANDFLTKPFEPDELVARVRSQAASKRMLLAEREQQRLRCALEESEGLAKCAKIDAERANMQRLRYQLNPHFLFNALAAIRGAIGQDPDMARRAVSDLSAFCQMTLAKAPRQWVTVAEEMDMVRAFLNVHRTRWGDYLDVSTEVDSASLNKRIPEWILQPLAENAVKYGSRTSPDHLHIGVTVRYSDEGRITLRVSNTGTLDGRQNTNHAHDQDAGSVGLRNLTERLERCYHDGYSFTLGTQDGSVYAEIVVPEQPD